MTTAVDVLALKGANQEGREGSQGFYGDRVGSVSGVQDERGPRDTGLEGTDGGGARGGREGGKEGWREGGREGERKARKEEEREGGREGGREGDGNLVLTVVGQESYHYIIP